VTQPELPLAREADTLTVPIEMIRRQPNVGAAFTLACNLSGLDDKEIYLSLGIDAGHFSRMKKGDAGFPLDLLREFCVLVKNNVFPEWIAYQVGSTLVLVKTEAERRAEEAIRRAEKAEAENVLLRSLVVVPQRVAA
jgi:hypothetical protein